MVVGEVGGCACLSNCSGTMAVPELLLSLSLLRSESEARILIDLYVGGI